MTEKPDYRTATIQVEYWLLNALRATAKATKRTQREIVGEALKRYLGFTPEGAAAMNSCVPTKRNILRELDKPVEEKRCECKWKHQHPLLNGCSSKAISFCICECGNEWDFHSQPPICKNQPAKEKRRHPVLVFVGHRVPIPEIDYANILGELRITQNAYQEYDCYRLEWRED